MHSVLFCLESSTVSGGNIVLLEMASRLRYEQHHCDVVFMNDPTPPRWFSGPINIVADFAEALQRPYDFVIMSNACQVPTILPYLNGARPILLCQSYEPVCYKRDYESLFAESIAFRDILKLPVFLISISCSVQKLLQERNGKASYLVPPAIEKEVFRNQRAQQTARARRRIMAVGDHLWPLKGINTLCEALTSLNRKFPVELVLITQQKRGLERLEVKEFPVEVHFRPPRAEVPAIYAGCDVYCCASWYEGFGLPALEAFASGIPVVSTRNYGVDDYGIHGHNMLLCEPNSATSIEEQLQLLLENQALQKSLIDNGFQTLERYSWKASIACLKEALESIAAEPYSPVVLNQEKQAELIKELHEEGMFTSTITVEILKATSQDLQTTLEHTISGAPLGETIHQLNAIRSKLKDNAPSVKSPFYADFQARIHLCGMLLSLSDDPQFQNHVRAIYSKSTKMMKRKDR